MTPPPCPPELTGALSQNDPARPPWRGPGRGTQVWLVRHGSVDAGDSAYGDLDVQLSEAGRRETEAAAAALGDLRPVCVASSPLSRALALGAAVAERAGCELIVDARLREVNRGAWQGLPLAEYHARWRADADAYWRDPFGWRGHAGDSEAELRARTTAALDALLAHSSLGHDTTLVVTAHRQAIRALIGAALGLPAVASHGLRLDTAHGCLLIDEPDGWTLARTNVAYMNRPPAAELASGPPLDVVARLAR
ncbi:MAG: histidine phosphatase family protein [Planctomycetota bacterium]